MPPHCYSHGCTQNAFIFYVTLHQTLPQGLDSLKQKQLNKKNSYPVLFCKKLFTIIYDASLVHWVKRSL